MAAEVPLDSPFRSANSSGFADLLERLGISLLVTTYQAGKLMAIRGRHGRVSTLLRGFERPMGLAVKPPWQLALGTRNQVWLFRNAPDIAAQLPSQPSYDACFLPRQAYVTGDIRGHEMAWGDNDTIWIVNTFFSCLCTLDPDYCFVPRWHPPFVQRPAHGDRCHLNGLALVNGNPGFVTALGECDVPDGWRAHKDDGGVVVDVARNAVICRGLSMPHSPRWHDNRLWVLESGTGLLLNVNPEYGSRTKIADLPGFARGLAFIGPYAFIGLSKIRETSTFGNLPIAARAGELQCGIWVIDVRSGRIVEFMVFQAGVEEIFAVEVLPNIRFPEVIGFQQDTIHGAFVIPSAPR